MKIIFFITTFIVLISTLMYAGVTLSSSVLAMCVLLSILLYLLACGNVILTGDIYVNKLDGTKVIVDEVIGDKVIYHYIQEGWYFNAHCESISTFNETFTKYEED